MIANLIAEISMRKNEFSAFPQTIYFGGGTPSLLTSREIEQILNAIFKHIHAQHIREITLEANPEDITRERIIEWKQLGINRLSIGIQSLKENDLRWMNRTHTVNQALESVQTAQKHGITNLSVDLIYGLPNLTNQQWISHLHTIAQLGVQHLSAYCLTVESNTVLGSWVKKGKIQPAQNQQQAEQFVVTEEILSKYGFIRYEISNFCLPNYESMHNSNYWKGTHYVGIGPSAHSYNGLSRSWNINNNQFYMQGIESGNRRFEQEYLSPNDRYNELLLVGLRTVQGVSIDKLQQIRPLPSVFFKEVEFFCKSGELVVLQHGDQKYICLTKDGLLRADFIASRLFV